jgi:hypothetical protein
VRKHLGLDGGCKSDMQYIVESEGVRQTELAAISRESWGQRTKQFGARVEARSGTDILRCPLFQGSYATCPKFLGLESAIVAL